MLKHKIKTRYVRLLIDSMLLLLCATLMPILSPVTNVYARNPDAMLINISLRDIWPPDAVTDLAATTNETIEGRITLNWTAPDENIPPIVQIFPVSSYDIRYTTFSVDSLSDNTTAWWNAAQGRYSIGYANNPGEEETQELTLMPGATYYFGIISYDDTLPEPLSSLIDTNSATPGQQASAYAVDFAPAEPGGLIILESTTSYVELTWNDLSPAEKTVDFDYYRIYRSSINQDTSYVAISTTTGITYTDYGIIRGATYYYCIGAVDKPPLVLESTSTAVSTYIPAKETLKPRYVVGVKLSISDNKATIYWAGTTRNEDGTVCDDLSGYRIYRSEQLREGWGKIKFVPDDNSETYSWADTLNLAGRVYYYKVTGIDSAGNESNDSMICDTSPDLNVIAISKDKNTFIMMPSEINNVLYKDKVYDDDIYIRIEPLTETYVPMSDVVSMYKFEAVKAINSEHIKTFQFAKPKAYIGLSYTDRGTVSAYSANAADKRASELGLFWFNGVEWIKLGSQSKDGSLGIFSNRLGSYMLKLSLTAQSFELSKVFPKIFTPNGDRRNDHVEFHYHNPFYSNTSGKIFDLRGALIAELEKGSNYMIWDGKTKRGDIAPPGVYIYQIEITGPESKIINGIVVLAK